MDPITAAILAAVATGIAKGADAVGGKVLTDAYEGLKAMIKRKFGQESDVVTAVEAVESKPESSGRKDTLAEEVAAAKADQDPEILSAAQALLEQLKALPGGAQYTHMEASGTGITQVRGDHNTTTVSGISSGSGTGMGASAGSTGATAPTVPPTPPAPKE